MNKNTTKYPSLKEIEQLVWRQLQETYSMVMEQLLEAIRLKIDKIWNIIE